MAVAVHKMNLYDKDDAHIPYSKFQSKCFNFIISVSVFSW